MSISRVWLRIMMLFCLGLVVYPFSLTIWIESGDNSSYYYDILIRGAVSYLQSSTFDESANDLFRLYHQARQYLQLRRCFMPLLLYYIGMA